MRQRKKQNLREARFGKCEPPDLPAPPVARRLRQRQPLRRGRLQGRQPWRGRNRPERTISIVAQHVTEDGVPPSLRSVPGASYRTGQLGLPPDNAQVKQPPAAVHHPQPIAGEGRGRQQRSLRPKHRLVFRFLRCWCSQNTAFSEPSRGARSACPSTDGDPPCKCCSSPTIRTPPSCAT